MSRPTIAIAGATGFVGRAFACQARDEANLVGLSRRPPSDPPPDGPHTWRRCDLFSLLDIEAALQGCDTALYLVHSMMPSARLTQANFADLDLLLADNFARGAAHAGVKRIIYVGGLIPQTDELSDHLRSRLEVESTLAGHGVPVTTLRAGLVVGAGGSSFRMLVKLVERLPAMLTPRWTETPTQPIAAEDLVALLLAVARDEAWTGQTLDVGGPDIITYREMIADTAAELGRTPWLVNVPLFTPRLSRLWVSLVTGQSRALVGPLVESLQHPMVARDRTLQDAVGIAGTPWRVALKRAMSAPAATTTTPAKTNKPSTALARRNTVRSVQRLPLPIGRSAHDIADEYMRFLPTFLWPFVRVDTEGDCIHFRTRALRVTLMTLRLAHERDRVDRVLFYVVGGRLAVTSDPPRGRLEFRVVAEREAVLAAVHEFEPRLPWYLYNATQAQAHLVVMRGFGRHLRALQPAPASSTS